MHRLDKEQTEDIPKPKNQAGSGRRIRLGALLLLYFTCSFTSRQDASATTPASLTVTPNTILSGDTVTISGAGLPMNTSILLWFDTNGNGQFDPEEPSFPMPLLTDSTGAIQNQQWTMTDIPAGALSIEAGICKDAPAAGLCYGTTGIAQAPITVTMGLSSSKFGSGNSVTITGYGFPASGSVNVWYDQDPNGRLASGDVSASPATDSQGAFSTSLIVSGNPGDYFVHVGPTSAATATLPVNIGTCWFQDCTINGADTICLLGNSPSDLRFAGVSFADCKAVDSNYTNPTPITAGNIPPGGYDLNNQGPVFLGAGVLAAATNDLGPPGTSCATMTAAIATAEAPPPVGYGNSVPDKLSLLAITCGDILGPIDLGTYIGAVELSGHQVPDKALITGAVLAVGGPAAPPPVQFVVAEAAVAGAVACGYVNYFCNGSDITKTILETTSLQTQMIPIPFLQPPIDNPASPNPCVAVGVTGKCWGDLIGWAQVACKSATPDYDAQKVGVCERPDGQGNYSQLAVPGSAGSPDNSGAPIQCTTGVVLGLSIGYDGDVSFDLTGSDVLRLVNYHNFQPGPGGSEPPNGIDIEIPVADRPLFMNTISALRPGMHVHVCGRWVADMHMLWNELHPITSLSILSPLTITANNATEVYGEPTPAFSVSYLGFVNGDTPSALGGTLACTTTATSASPVASYPITCSGQTSSTYDIQYVPGTLAITPAALTVTANNATRLYGSPDPPFTTSPGGLVNGDTLASIGISPTCSSAATQGSPVGSYPITCTGPSSTTNYTISYQGGTLKITAAPLTITAKDTTKVLNAPNPALTATYAGFVNAETPSSLTGTLNCSTTANTTSPIGSYPITCSGQSSTNYSITYVPGTLKILYASSGICGGDAGHQILQPINPDGSSVWKQGRTVPAKFRVCDANVVSIGTPGVVSSFMLVQIIGGTMTDVDEAVSSTTPDTAFRWDASGQQWIFNISTSDLSAGQTYVYSIQLNDGSNIGFRFGLR